MKGQVLKTVELKITKVLLPVLHPFALLLFEPYRLMASSFISEQEGLEACSVFLNH